jgi:hypothetical protein
MANVRAERCGALDNARQCQRKGLFRYQREGPRLCQLHYNRAVRRGGETRTIKEIDAIRARAQKEKFSRWKQEMDERYGKK